LIWINTKIIVFASGTYRPSKNLTKIRRQFLELLAKFVKLPYPAMVQIPVKNSCVFILILITTKI